MKYDITELQWPCLLKEMDKSHWWLKDDKLDVNSVNIASEESDKITVNLPAITWEIFRRHPALNPDLYDKVPFNDDTVDYLSQDITWELLYYLRKNFLSNWLQLSEEDQFSFKDLLSKFNERGFVDSAKSTLKQEKRFLIDLVSDADSKLQHHIMGSKYIGKSELERANFVLEGWKYKGFIPICLAVDAKYAKRPKLVCSEFEKLFLNKVGKNRKTSKRLKPEKFNIISNFEKQCSSADIPETIIVNNYSSLFSGYFEVLFSSLKTWKKYENT